MVEDFPSGKFVTLIYAVLDPAKRMLRFASAGHLPPLLIDRTGGRFLQTESGMPLGLTFGEYSDTELQLGEGARLLLYSDGITEAAGPDNEEYGPERLCNHISRGRLDGDHSGRGSQPRQRCRSAGRCNRDPGESFRRLSCPSMLNSLRFASPPKIGWFSSTRQDFFTLVSR